ncbi:PAS domain S-box protein [Neobacillus mesonae]|uniref:PAS domain S-box protein n=1 Tax=Neobacillus mesonae TaxID=1193713 RepID=UPI00203A9F6B|nr:PAS domain S-box protein [Neobacillus mesonae]MCM3571307.1 PAS domain S-box protein [Neobacillus mesonae]
MLLDKQGTILYASPSLNMLLGFQSKSCLGESSSDLIHPDDRDKVMFEFQQILNKKSPSGVEARFLDYDGNGLLIEGHGTPVLGSNGEMEHLVVVGRDITEKRKTEERLAKAEKLAVVGDLAAGVAHQIRNPITSIKGFIQLLQQGIQNPEYFNIIFGEFQRIEDILQEFLNLAKPKSSNLQMNNLTSILQDVETLLRPEANLKSIQIFQEYQNSLPNIMCDHIQIKQVFINIMKNSIEAIVNAGTINIVGSLEQKNILIKIIDNGIGN